MEKSIVYVENIWAEDLFKWFYEHIMDSCGDGSAVIVCENYAETADLFIQWWRKNFLGRENFKWFRENCPGKEFFHDRDECGDIINFHDDNESFMFSNNPNINLFFHEYIFIVRKDCEFGWSGIRNPILAVHETDRESSVQP